MKNLLFYTIIGCLLSLSSTAQQNNSLSGEVLFLNSGKKPAVGVEISAHIKGIGTTKPVYTAKDGSFTLLFSKAATGKSVHLTIGDTDAGGQAIELVNDREVRTFKIPANPKDRFVIIVGKKGERDAMAQHYYKLIKTSADRELAKRKKEKAALLDEKEKDYEKIAELSERITELEKQADSIPVYKEAYRITSINKDNATKRVLKYLELLDEGKSIQETSKILHIVDYPEKNTSQFEVAVEGFGIFSWASKYNNMGMVYAKNRQLKQAHAAFTAYEQRFPNEGLTFRNWAVYYALQDENEKATMYLQRAIQLGYDDVKWLKTDDSMKSLRDEKVFIEMVEKLENKTRK